MGRRGGFTLLEVVIGLAIAGLALVALFEAGSGGLFAAETTARAKEAVERAQSRLAALDADGVLPIGVTGGDDGGGFSWRASISPIDVAADAGAGQPTLYAVEVVVSWREHRRLRSVSLASRRISIAGPLP